MSRSCPNPCLSRGFSLIELLAVIVIASILSVLAGLGFSQISSSRAANDAAEDITGIIRSARAFAMAQNTYAVVGLRNAIRDNLPVVEVATSYSLDGIEPTAGSVSNPALAPRGKTHRFRQVHIQPQATSMDAALSAAIPDAGNLSDLSDADFAFAAPAPQGSFQWRLLITPSGEISLDTANALLPATIIGLSNIRSNPGDIPPANAAVIVRGTIGQASAVHP